MRFSVFSLLLTAGSVLSAPEELSPCDFYTKKALGSASPENQHTMMNWIVNRFAFGNHTLPDGRKITGFLWPGKFQGHEVNLLPYFNGGLASLNQGGPHGVAVNMLTLDASGMFPKPPTITANGTNLVQNIHLTHVYSYFGKVMGCTGIGIQGFQKYVGPSSTYEVHKFMYLSNIQVGYFIEQIALSAESFGWDKKTTAKISKIFNEKFNQRCSPPEVIFDYQLAQHNSLCTHHDCPLHKDPDCPTNQPPAPKSTNMTLSFGQGNGMCKPGECDGDGEEVYVSEKYLTYPNPHERNQPSKYGKVRRFLNKIMS